MDAARWKMLGHLLRYEHDAPAYLALKFCVFAEKNRDLFKCRLGAPCMNLLNVYRKDLLKRDINNNLKCLDDLEGLKFLAMDKLYWKRLAYIM